MKLLRPGQGNKHGVSKSFPVVGILLMKVGKGTTFSYDLEHYRTAEACLAFSYLGAFLDKSRHLIKLLARNYRKFFDGKNHPTIFNVRHSP